MKISSDDSSATVHAPIYSDSQLINNATSKKRKYVSLKHKIVVFVLLI